MGEWTIVPPWKAASPKSMLRFPGTRSNAVAHGVATKYRYWFASVEDDAPIRFSTAH